MARKCAGLATLLALAAGAWLGLGAREEKAEVDDLALVPATARLMISVRPAEMWDSDLGKEIRKGLGKDLDLAIKHLEKELGTGPAGIERATMVILNIRPGENLGFLLKFKEKVEADEMVARFVRGGREEKIAGQKVMVNDHAAAFVKGGKLVGMGTLPAVKAMLEGEAKPGANLAEAIKRAASAKHSVVGYVEPGLFGMKESDVPPFLALVKPMLELKSAVGWADVGKTVKLSARLSFANEAAAARGRKSLEAGRAVGIATLAALSGELGKGPKGLAELATLGESSLEKATIKADENTVDVSLDVNAGKAPLIAMVAEAATRMRAAATQARSQNNLKQIGLAMHNYLDVNGVFPPQAIYDKDGKALLSWRVLILPYLEQDNLYKKFKLDEPWDSDHNKKLLAQMPPVYAPVTGKGTVPFGTYYQGFFGKGAAFEGKRGLKITSFTDGTSNTILAVEAGKDVPWSKPDDVPFDADGKQPKLGGLFANGFNTLFADGSVRFMTRKVSWDTLKAVITRDGGEVVGADF